MILTVIAITLDVWHSHEMMKWRHKEDYWGHNDVLWRFVTPFKSSGISFGRAQQIAVITWHPHIIDLKFCVAVMHTRLSANQNSGKVFLCLRTVNITFRNFCLKISTHKKVSQVQLFHRTGLHGITCKIEIIFCYFTLSISFTKTLI